MLARVEQSWLKYPVLLLTVLVFIAIVAPTIQHMREEAFGGRLIREVKQSMGLDEAQLIKKLGPPGLTITREEAVSGAKQYPVESFVPAPPYPVDHKVLFFRLGTAGVYVYLDAKGKATHYFVAGT